MPPPGLQLIMRACGALHFEPPNGGPGGWSFTLQSGDFSPVVIVNGTGDIAIDFLAGNGIIAAAVVMIATPRGVLNPSGLTSIAVEHVSPVRKRFTILREQGGGAASVRADVDFDFACWSLPGR